MKNPLTEQLGALIGPVITGLGYEFVGLEYVPQGKHSLLRIYIDHESGITLDDCEQVSHQVSGVLDVEDPIRGQYMLEVSSPGADRPLFTREHFMRFIGREVTVRLGWPLDGRRKYTGVLQGMVDDAVLIDSEGEQYRLPFEQIDRARLVPDI